MDAPLKYPIDESWMGQRVKLRDGRKGTVAVFSAHAGGTIWIAVEDRFVIVDTNGLSPNGSLKSIRCLVSYGRIVEK